MAISAYRGGTGIGSNPLLKAIRILLIDLDGTLLDDQQRLPESNAAALETISPQRIIALCTGRSTVSAKTVTERLRQSIRYIIASAGACITDTSTGTCDTLGYFDRKILIQLQRFALQWNFASIFYTADESFAEPISAAAYNRVSRSKIAPTEVNTISLELACVKIMFVGSPEQILSAHGRIGAEIGLGDSIVVHRTYPEYLEISPGAISKSKAVELLLNRLNYTWDQVIAFGDGTNDLDVLTKARLSVAVANAHQQVLQTASIITPSNTEGGVGVAVRGLFLNDDRSFSRLEFRDMALKYALIGRP